MNKSVSRLKNPTPPDDVSDAEARVLKKILGDCAGDGPTRKHTANIYGAINYAGVVCWNETDIEYNGKEILMIVE